MTAQQIQTIGNAWLSDLVAWGRRRSGCVGGRRRPPGCCGFCAKRRPALVGEAVVAFFGQNEMIEEGCRTVRRPRSRLVRTRSSGWRDVPRGMIMEHSQAPASS